MSKEESFEKNYAMLNPEQKAAVETMYGPVMVVAGPGTGKTQIIGLRTANIIKQTGVNPDNVLITTFTDAGVIAIKIRLVDFMGEDAYKVNVVTIHGFADDVIKTFPEKFIEERAGSVIDEVDSIELLEEIFDGLIEDKKLEYLTSFGDKYFYLRTVKSKIGILKQEGVSRTDFRKSIDNQRSVYNQKLEALKTNKRIRDLEKRTAKDKETFDKHIGKLEELLLIFNEYQSRLKQKNLYDFNDMINFVLQKFKVDDDLKSHYAEKFQFIMLDEFQDTNNAQNQIIDSILSVGEDSPNLMVVGDDDQSIYRFQGANIENILGFFTKYSDTKVVVLKYNYRSIQPILDTASALIDNNDERINKRVDFVDKSLFSGRDDYKKYESQLPSVINFTTDIDEKIFTLQKINEIKGEVNYDDIAIIVRSNKEIQDWTDFLQSENIPVESKLKSDILKSNYVEFILNVLGLISNPYFDDSKFLDIILSDLVDVVNIDVFRINKTLYNNNYTKKFKVNLLDYLSKTDFLEKLDLQDFDKIIEFRDMFEELSAQMRTLSFIEFFNNVITQFGIIEYIESHGNFDDLQDVFTLLNTIKKFSDNDKNLSVEKFLNKIDLYKKHNQIIPRQISKKSKSGVQLITAHSSKGLEFHTVFIPGVNYGAWDGKRVMDLLKLPEDILGEGLQYANLEDKEITKIKKQKTLEEERRLFFVAITRAEKNLFISIPGSRDNKILLPSSFIEEIKNNIENIDSSEVLDVEYRDAISQNFIKKSLTGLTLQNDISGELDYIEEFLINYKLSPSDLNKFLEDPKVFLKEAVFKYPFVDNVFTIFGKVYHRVLELFFLEYKETGKLLDKKYLISTFKLLLEKEVLTLDEFEQLLEKGLEGLEGYYDMYEKQFQEPLELEYNFRSRNIRFEGVPLTGKVDKIEISGSAENKTDNIDTGGQMAFFKEAVSLVDFKTGSSKSLGVIKGIDRAGNKKAGYEHGKYYRQLLFYKLLCEQDSDFSSKYEVDSLVLDFVEGKNKFYKQVNVDYSIEDYNEFKELIKDTWSKINDLDYWKRVLEN